MGVSHHVNIMTLDPADSSIRVSQVIPPYLAKHSERP